MCVEKVCGGWYGMWDVSGEKEELLAHNPSRNVTPYQQYTYLPPPILSFVDLITLVGKVEHYILRKIWICNERITYLQLLFGLMREFVDCEALLFRLWTSTVFCLILRQRSCSWVSSMYSYCISPYTPCPALLNYETMIDSEERDQSLMSCCINVALHGTKRHYDNQKRDQRLCWSFSNNHTRIQFWTRRNMKW